MLDRLIALLAPHLCVACGSEGSLLCAWCRPDTMHTLPERCYRCHQLSADSAVCATCRRASPLKHVWVHAFYSGAAKKLIYQLKFGRAKTAAAVMADLLDDTLPALPLDTVVTYIPTATSRVRIRGYDQSRLLARALAKRRGLRAERLLVRYGQTRQVGSSRSQRIKQAAQNYSLATDRSLKGSTILLIDDIITTGATLEMAAKVLRQADPSRIYAAAFAQKQ